MTPETTAGESGGQTAKDEQPLIFIVEDVPLIHTVIARTLAHLEPRFVVCTDGRSALSELEKAVPSLMILDLALPVIDGWEVLKRVRASERTASVPVLVMTAHGQSGLEQEVMALGADAYLDKPFHPKKLRTTVENLLARS